MVWPHKNLTEFRMGPTLTQIWRLFSYLVPLVAISIVLLMPVVILRRRKLIAQGCKRVTVNRRVLLESGMLAYGLSVAAVVLSPQPLVGTSDSIDSRPFVDLASALVHGQWLDHAVIQAVGNTLMLVPLGLLMCLRWPRRSLRVHSFVALIAGFLIEFLQFVLPINRVASLEDVLENAAGASFGALAVIVFRLYGNKNGLPEGRPKSYSSDPRTG